ncbi:MAG TPA: hypothetical protein VIH47_09640, partial [Solirubrobacterales bacterium]
IDVGVAGVHRSDAGEVAVPIDVRAPDPGGIGGPDRWRSFDQLYGSTYKKITATIAPSKPLMVSEVGSTEYGGSKAAWIKDMLAKIPTAYPKIRGLLWFEKYDDGMDWPIETSASATSAFAEGIQNPAYAENEFGSLAGSGPVQAAS